MIEPIHIRQTAISLALALLALPGPAWAADQAPGCQAPVGQAIRPLAERFVTVYESPDPAKLFCYSPGLARLENGRLVATLDLSGPGAATLPGPKFHRQIGYGRWWQGKVFTSDDGGRTWTHRVDFPFMHARRTTET